MTNIMDWEGYLRFTNLSFIKSQLICKVVKYLFNQWGQYWKKKVINIIFIFLNDKRNSLKPHMKRNGKRNIYIYYQLGDIILK